MRRVAKPMSSELRSRPTRAGEILIIVPTINVRDAELERQHEGEIPKQSRNVECCNTFEITSLRS